MLQSGSQIFEVSAKQFRIYDFSQQHCQVIPPCLPNNALVNQLPFLFFSPSASTLGIQACGVHDQDGYEQLLSKAEKLDELHCQYLRAAEDKRDARRAQYELPDGRIECPCGWRGDSDCLEGYCDRCCYKEGHDECLDEKEANGFGRWGYGGYRRWY